MNVQYSFNDTFDDLSFSVSKNCLQICDENYLKLTESVPNLHKPLADVKTKKLYNNVEKEITLDDSIFLNESFNVNEKNTDLQNTQEVQNESQVQKDVHTSFNNGKVKKNDKDNLIINSNKQQVEDSVCKKSDLKNLKSLSEWGLPETILQKYKSHNVIDMFEWQVQCLSNQYILRDRKNLVYSAPTSAGKTLVAEILAIKTVLELRRKVIFVLPFVSVVREKMFYFQDILGSSGIRVEGFMGSYNPPGFASVQVAICTIEKANSIINRLLEEKRLGELGAVIIDEMHLLGDPSRGYQLELLLTKLRYMTIKEADINIQIIGMSATLPNLDLLAKWLDAELYTTTFRPIPLNEHCHVNGEIYDSNLKFKRKLLHLQDVGTDTDNILHLCLETIFDSCSVLIFCPTKNWCESLSQQIAMAIWNIGKSTTELSKKLRNQFNPDNIIEVLEQLRCCPVGLDKLLEKIISFGVSFHHAGLTMDERDIIEGAFKRGAIRVLIATSTLSSGVNLPARRVIIRTPTFHGRTIDTLIYRQMIGRAGRMGKDTCGESILICQKSDYAAAKELMSAKLSPIESCLEGSGKLKRAILEVIASEVASTPTDIALFTDCTLLALNESLNNPIEKTVDFLIENEFIRLQKLDNGTFKYFATPLGKACLSSSMPPEEGLTLFAELQKARQCFVLDTELHIIYLVTPYSVCNQWGNIDWIVYLEMWEKLPSSMKRVGELVGISELYLINQARGKIQPNTTKSYHKLQVHKRFYTALALQDLVNELPLNDVSKKFNCSRGLLQSLQQSAASFAGMVTSFSRQLGWSTIEILVSQFQDRLQFGVNRELLDLMRLPILDGQRARALFNNGIETLVDLASSDIYTLENILYKATPFESEKKIDGETDYDVQKRNKLRTIWITGKQGLTAREAADVLINYSRQYLQFELGLSEVKWGKNNDDVSQSSHLSKNIHNSKIIDKLDIEINAVTDEENKNRKKIAIECDTSLNKSLKKNMRIQSTPNNKTVLSFHKSQDYSPVANKSNVNDNDNITTSLSHSLFSESSESFAQLEENIFNDKSLEYTGDFQNKQNISNHDVINDSGFELNSCLAEDIFDASVNINKIEQDIDKLADLNLNKSMEQIDWGSDIDLNSQCLENYTCNKENIEQLKINSRKSTHYVSDDSIFEIDSSDEANKKKSNHLEVLCDKSPNISEDDFIVSSQIDKHFDSLSFVAKTPRKRQRTSTSLELTLKTPSKKTKFSLYNYKQQTTFNVIKDNDLLSDNSNKRFATSKNEKITANFSSLEIVNVCADEKIFSNFYEEISNKKEMSFSIACCKEPETKQIIGQKLINKTQQVVNQKKFSYEDRLVNGFCFSWGGNVAYYLSLEEEIVKTNKIINLLKTVFSNKETLIRIFDSKEQLKVLNHCCDININCAVEDPKVADWLLQPDSKEKNMQAMTLLYTPEVINLAQMAGNCKGVGSIGLDLHSSIASKIRASVEVVVTYQLVNAIKEILYEKDERNYNIYELEMNSILCLTQMELDGFAIDTTKLQSLADILKQLCLNIEKKAYQLAGRKFSFTSTKDVAKIIGIYKGKRVSTSKQVLELNEHPVAKLILQWRKINSTLTKMIYPLLRVIVNGRIHVNCITFNSTGRISMQEPNLQNIPRDFFVFDHFQNKNIDISCRSSFAVKNENILVSADYCQLELRILAHLCQDSVLCSVMKSDQDVFKLIAAKWNNVDINEIDDDMRQNAKHICYGIIYGMGKKTLADQLCISEEQATDFVASFHKKYVCISQYIQNTIESCQKTGYVETIIGRRRYLPHINHNDSALKNQAERQAVNTRIQGSAADIAKNAMVLIEKHIKEKFDCNMDRPKLVLQLHDELIYEVSSKHKILLGLILKQCMEDSVQLSVPFPIKLKSGSSWGTMEEFLV